MMIVYVQYEYQDEVASIIFRLYGCPVLDTCYRVWVNELHNYYTDMNVKYLSYRKL